MCDFSDSDLQGEPANLRSWRRKREGSGVVAVSLECLQRQQTLQIPRVGRTFQWVRERVY